MSAGHVPPDSSVFVAEVPFAPSGTTIGSVEKEGSKLKFLHFMVKIDYEQKHEKQEDHMGLTPDKEGITINFECQIEVRLKDATLCSILAAFKDLLSQLLPDFIQKMLVGYAEHIMGQKQKPFACGSCGNNKELTWKTKHGKATKILTVYQWVVLKHLQVLCKKCGHKFYITRSLLGIEPNKRIPAQTYRSWVCREV